MFFYLPFGHSETLADQERCVALAARLGDPIRPVPSIIATSSAASAAFPIATPSSAATTTAEEQRYLDEGGYKG